MSQPVTELLYAWRSGDDNALDQLFPLVYDELRAIANRRLRAESSGHTLQATELVHEAYGRLVGANVDWKDRAHFLAVAARSMRQVLVDHARRRSRAKRGGGVAPVTLNDEIAGATGSSDQLLALDEALSRLAQVDERKAKVIELHFFGGLTYKETAEALGISQATVDRDLRMGRSWLLAELSEE